MFLKPSNEHKWNIYLAYLHVPLAFYLCLDFLWITSYLRNSFKSCKTVICSMFKIVTDYMQVLDLKQYQCWKGNKSAQWFQNEEKIIQTHGEDVHVKTRLGRGHYNFKAMTKIQFKSIETILQCQDDGKIMPM